MALKWRTTAFDSVIIHTVSMVACCKISTAISNDVICKKKKLTKIVDRQRFFKQIYIMPLAAKYMPMAQYRYVFGYSTLTTKSGSRIYTELALQELRYFLCLTDSKINISLHQKLFVVWSICHLRK